MLGILTGLAGEISTAALTMKQIKLKGVVVGNLEDQEQVIQALEVNHVIPVIDRSFPLAQLSEGFRFQAQAKHFGRIAITF